MSEQFFWIDPNGNETPLSGSPNIEVLIGPSGRFMPQFDITELQIPMVSGTVLKNIVAKSREINLPLGITGASKSDLRTQLRNLLKVFDPTIGDGTLKIIAEDGSQRIIKCRYSGGMEIEETGLPWLKVDLVLKAFDPFWYDPNTIVQTFSNGTSATFFPFFPLRLTSSTVFADTTVENNGDVEAWPQWTITGPGDNIYLRNLSTGGLINISYTLGNGETITIDTRFGNKTVTKNDGTNLYIWLSDDSSLWSLQQGTNQIRIEMTDATNDSSVQLTFQNRYWSA